MRATAPRCSRIRSEALPISSRRVCHEATTASITIGKLGIPWRCSGGK